MSVYGATFYNPGLTPYLSGIKNPSGTISLAQQAKLNALRITNFLPTTGDVTTTPYDETSWQRVDAFIAAAKNANMKVTLSLSDYRKLLWNNCVDPYTYSWFAFVKFVANRVNTVTGVTYKNDPTIAWVSISGEPVQPGSYTFVASGTGKSCTIKFTTAQLTNFYENAMATWKIVGATVLVNSGGLTHLDLANSGIDWKSIFSYSSNDFCAIKTYGGMLDWAPNAAAYCASLGKPIVDEEFGYTQSMGDVPRAQAFEQQYSTLQNLHFAGVIFWNLGYELASTSYEVNPSTPWTFATVQNHAP